jgi:hypothetical protein
MRGHVYILINARMPGLLKIGQTTRTPEERAQELSCGTAVPTPFAVAWSVPVSDCEAAERAVHARLAPYRDAPGREFFAAPLPVAIAVLTEVATAYRVVPPPLPGSVPPPLPASAPPGRGEGRFAHWWRSLKGGVARLTEPTYTLKGWTVTRDGNTARVRLHGEGHRLFTGAEEYTECATVGLLPQETDPELVLCAVAVSAKTWRVGLWTNISKFRGAFYWSLSERLRATLPKRGATSSSTTA